MPYMAHIKYISCVQTWCGNVCNCYFLQGVLFTVAWCFWQDSASKGVCQGYQELFLSNKAQQGNNDTWVFVVLACGHLTYSHQATEQEQGTKSKPFGLLVPLGCIITDSIPAAYQRSHLLRSLGLLQQGCLILEQVSRFRCFQRLSFLDMATLPCHWHDNRYTVGPVIPVLSY